MDHNDYKMVSLDESTRGDALSVIDQASGSCTDRPSFTESPENSISQSMKPSFIESIKAWVCLSLAIMSGAAIGPMFKFMASRNIKPALSASWRCQCMVIFLVPIALFEIRGEQKQGRSPIEWFKKKPGLPYSGKSIKPHRYSE